MSHNHHHHCPPGCTRAQVAGIGSLVAVVVVGIPSVIVILCAFVPLFFR